MTERALNQPAEIPAELDRWNWGAFFLNWIWGIGNSVFIALLAFIPVVNLIMIFVLGAKGSKWAWRNRAWRDADHFRSVQRKWAIAGLVIWIAVFALAAALTLGLPRMIKGSEAYALTMEAARADTRVTEALGAGWSDAYWIAGNVEVGANGSGNARYAIPVSGPAGSGTMVSRGVRVGGVWDMRLIVVELSGRAPIVLVNKDNIAVPDAGLDI